MRDEEISVKLTADVKSMLHGMKEAQEKTEQAVQGMKGNLTSLIASFEALGPAVLVVAAVGFAWEAIKEAMSFIPEAIAHTNELVESYHQLAITAGLTAEEFNGLNATIQMAGGKTSDLNAIVQGMQRGIKANGDSLVENGIAANKAALSHMSLGEYIAAVTHKMETYGDATDKDQLLMAAFGRSGIGLADTLEKLNKYMAEGTKYGIENAVVTEAAGKATEDLKQVKGQLAAAEDTLKASVAGVTIEYDIQIQKMKLGTVQWINDMTTAQKLAKEGKIAMQTEMVFDNEGQQVEIENWTAMIAAAKEYLHTQAALHAEEAKKEKAEKGTGKFVSPASTAAAKAAHDQQIALAKDAAQESLKAALDSIDQQIKADQHLVAMEMLAYEEAAANAKAWALTKLEDQEAEAAKELKLAEGNALAIRQINNKLAEDYRHYKATIEDIQAKTEEHLAQEDDKAAKKKLELSKLAAQDELDLQKTVLAIKEQALDQDLAFGRINEAQWTAAKKAGVTQRLQADLDALSKEQAAAKDDLVAWNKIQNQKDALNRKVYLEMGKLDQEAVNASRARWSGFFSSMTGGFDSAVQGLVKGTMTWGDAFKEVTDQALSGIISFFVRWAEEEAIKWATSLAMSKVGNGEEATGAAALYAVNAMASVAAIPLVGWAMAPEVGATAYGEGLAMAGLASAAGGWDRVPSDQVAQIHKNEMILPDWAADGARKTFAAANEGRAPGGGNVNINITAMDGQDVHRVLSRHQESLFRVMREGVRNRRLR